MSFQKLLLPLLLGSTVLPAAAANCQLAEVAARDNALNQAILTKQTDLAATFYADQFVLTTSTGKRKDKAALLTEIGADSLSLTINQTADVQVFGDQQTAVLLGRLHQRGEYQQQAFDAQVWVTDTWVCADNGRWLLLAGHASKS